MFGFELKVLVHAKHTSPVICYKASAIVNQDVYTHVLGIKALQIFN